MIAIEGRGPVCLIPVPCLPAPQQRELPAALREDLELHFVLHDEPGVDPLAGLERARAQCGQESVGLIGSSSLGILCAAFAERYPERTRFLVLVGTPPTTRGLDAAQWAHWEEFASEKRKRLLAERRESIDESAVPRAERYVTNKRIWAPMGYADALFDPSELMSGIQPVSGNPAAAFAQDFSRSLEEVLPLLTCPVLRIQGALDYIAPASLWGDPSLGEHVRVRIFDRSGHHPSFEEPERFVDEVRALLGENS